MFRLINLVLFCLILFAFFAPTSVFAESINSFDVSLTAKRDGSMEINESIKYNFGDLEKHGIFRNIPLVSRVGDLYRVISIEFIKLLRDGNSEQYSIDNNSKEVEVKIGDPNKTISGIHTYNIVYEVKNGIGSNYEDHDEIYWNVTGNNWQIPINSASFTIKTDFEVTPGKTICFTGSQGSKVADCQIEEVNGSKKVVLMRPLLPYEGLTVVTSFPVNTFPKSELQKNQPVFDPDFLAFFKILIPIYLLLNLGLAPYLIYWYNKQKNKVRFGQPTVNFDIPEYPKKERVSPAEAGTIDNTKLDKDDISATIFDLAIRKYIKIEQIKKVKNLRPDEVDYKLIKLKEFEGLNEFEQTLTDKIFDGSDEVLVKNIKLDYLDFSGFEKKNFSLLIGRGFYTKNPKSQKTVLLVFGIIALSFLNIFLGPVLIWLSTRLNGRTQIGDEMDFKIDGLKIFLKNMKRYYKWQAESGYFVEKYIPYAMALGFIDEYMEQLKILNPKYKPSFYSGSNFYANYALFNSSFSSNITTSAPSSSSGFSGGSSGGGGGGGGGGSW